MDGVPEVMSTRGRCTLFGPPLVWQIVRCPSGGAPLPASAFRSRANCSHLLRHSHLTFRRGDLALMYVDAVRRFVRADRQ
jgi:hypothetical protein